MILYLHGGGYTCGDLEYAKGFGAVLAAQEGVRVLCPAYRLAPEHPFPAALEDAAAAYQYLLDKGYGPGKILLCGESAGGGCATPCACICGRGKIPLPLRDRCHFPVGGLTCSGESYPVQQGNRPNPDQGDTGVPCGQLRRGLGPAGTADLAAAGRSAGHAALPAVCRRG